MDAILAYATGDHQIRVNTMGLAGAGQVTRTSQFNFSTAELATQATFDGWGGNLWALKPRIKAGLNVFEQNRERLETGQAADIYVEKLEQSRGYVELGAVFDQALTDRIGAFGRLAGVQYFGDTETAFVSNFIGAPAGTHGFRTIGDTVEKQVEVEAYLSIDLPTDFELSAGGFAEAGDLEAQGARITLKKTF